MMEARKLAELCAQKCLEKKAENVVVLDLEDKSSVADYFVVCSGLSDRQVATIAVSIPRARAVLDEAIANIEDTRLKFRREVQQQLALPFSFDTLSFTVTASCGIALYPGDGNTPDELMASAERAMHWVKEGGRTGFRFHVPRREVDLLSRMRLDHAMRQALVEGGNTVVVIEHNLEVIKTADWIIDLGPEGGDQGGQLVASGTPEAIAAVPASHTGRAIARLLPALRGRQAA